MPKGENRAESRIVIVGAGIGGLAAALALSAAGRRVTVLERHAHIGGKARNVGTFAGPAPAGPTVMTMRPVFDGLFAAAGARLEDHVRIHREPLLARHFWEDGSTLDLTDDQAMNEAAIAAFAGPREAAAFRRFAADARRLYEGFEAPMMEAAAPTFGALALHVLRHPSLIPAMTPHLTLAQALARRFADPRLRQLFGRYATYVGGAPGRSPALLSLIWDSEARGVWRVEGGIAALAAAMARLAEAHGAEFRLGAHVEEIETERGAATGLRLAGGERIAAKTILFNGDPAALRRGLLGPGAREAVTKPAVSPRSLSAHVWSFAAEPSRPDLAHHNVFFGPDPAREFGPIEAGAMPEAPSLYVCAADRGENAAPAGPERFEIIMNGAPDEPGRAEERERCRDLTFGTLARFGLTFSPAPGPESLTTPRDFAALFPGSDGSLYGRSPHGAMAAFARPTARSRVPGLFLCGGGTHPGAGVPMAARSGLRAAEAILAAPSSTSMSARTATPGGISTGSATTGRAPSPSSAS